MNKKYIIAFTLLLNCLFFNDLFAKTDIKPKKNIERSVSFKEQQDLILRKKILEEFENLKEDLSTTKGELKEFTKAKNRKNMTTMEISARKKELKRQMKILNKKGDTLNKQIVMLEDYHNTGLPYLAEDMKLKPYTYDLPFAISFDMYQTSHLNGFDDLSNFKSKIINNNTHVSSSISGIKELGNKTSFKTENVYYGAKFDVNLLPFLNLNAGLGYHEIKNTMRIDSEITIPIFSNGGIADKKINFFDKVENNTKSVLMSFAPKLYWAAKYFFVEANADFIYIFPVSFTDEKIAEFLKNTPFVTFNPRIGLNFSAFSIFGGINKTLLFSSEEMPSIDFNAIQNVGGIKYTSSISANLPNYLFTTDLSYSVGGKIKLGKKLHLTGEYNFIPKKENSFRVLVSSRF